jgi:hypothetical protein
VLENLLASEDPALRAQELGLIRRIYEEDPLFKTNFFRE